MKTLTLKVTIQGGSSQLGIYYRLIRNGKLSAPIHHSTSFEQVFNDLEGDYILFIGGGNADSNIRKTIIELTFDENQIILDRNLSYANPSAQKGKHIYAEYYFNA